MQKFDFAYVTAHSMPDALKAMVETCLKTFANNPRAEFRQLIVVPQIIPVANKGIVKPGQEQEFQQVFHLIGIVGELDREVSDQIQKLQAVITNDLPGMLSAGMEMLQYSKGESKDNMPT
jgi:hypothetical protein